MRRGSTALQTTLPALNLHAASAPAEGGDKVKPMAQEGRGRGRERRADSQCVRRLDREALRQIALILLPRPMNLIGPAEPARRQPTRLPGIAPLLRRQNFEARRGVLPDRGSWPASAINRMLARRSPVAPIARLRIRHRRQPKCHQQSARRRHVTDRLLQPTTIAYCWPHTTGHPLVASDCLLAADCCAPANGRLLLPAHCCPPPANRL